ncbi:MAG: DUF6531 domain-containing protein [Oscillospiraceae bacterium]|nr:DUF6531 domain-containing protein [Oscillospiraceae bacterium]
MQGYSGAPAKHYLRICEEAYTQADVAIASAAARMPVIPRPGRRFLPHTEGDAVFSPGATAGIESGANIVASSGAYTSAASEHKKFGEEISSQLQKIYDDIDDIVESNLKMPQTSAQVKLVTQMLKRLIPELKGLLGKAESLTSRQADTMLSIGGGGDGFELQRSLADSYRLENETCLRNMSEDMRKYAKQAIFHADRCDSLLIDINRQISKLQVDIKQMSSKSVATTPTQISAKQNMEYQLRQNTTKLVNEAQDYRDGAKQLGQAADNLDTDISNSKQLYEQYCNLCVDCDSQFAGEFQVLSTQMQSLSGKFQVIMSSFCPVAGIVDWDSLLMLKRQMSPVDQAALTLLFLKAMLELAGKRDFCLFGFDPVNLSTGNFIYSKEDISISGRFPLEFKRFYNSIGGTGDVLGSGWTHNYNIYLEDKETAVTVTFGDGHVETYTKSKDKESEKNKYISTPGCENNLQKTDTGWGLLTNVNDTYSFDKDGFVQNICDQNGNATKFEHKDMLLHKVSTSSGSLIFEYDDCFLIKVADHTGREVKLEYSGVLLNKITNPIGAEYTYYYDSYGNLSSVTNPLGIEVITNTYDGDGRMTGQSFADGGKCSLSYKDRITTTAEQNGNEIKYEHDNKYRTIRTIYSDSEERFEYNGQNKRTKYVNRNGNETCFEYDERGNVTKVTDALGYTTELEYNGSNLVKVSREENVMAKLSYDNFGNVTEAKDALERTSKIEYDDVGSPVKVTAPDDSVIAVEYGSRGNVASITDAMGGITQYEYDELNRVTVATDPNGNSTKFEYNANDDISKVTNAEGNDRNYEYNANGKVTSIVDFDGSVMNSKYNCLGKPSKFTDQEGNETKLEYDLMWNVSKQTDANGNETFFEYNALNRLEKVVNTKGASVHYDYDPNGNRIKVTGAKGEEVKISYDALDRVCAVTEPDGAEFSVEYNFMGQVTKLTDPMGNISTFEYDTVGQKISQTDPSSRELKFSYTLLGQISEVTDSIGRKTKYDYLPGGLLKRITYPDGKYVEYDYDKNKNIISKKSHDGYMLRYEYDSLNRIICISSNTGQKKLHTYDAVGNVTSITDANGNTTKYKYSQIGNLVSVIDPLGNVSEYDYDKLGNLLEVKQFDELNEAVKLNEENSKLRVTRYEWNQLSQVEKVIDAFGNTETYSYDETGNVSSKLDKEGFLTKYAYNVTNQLEEVVYADGNSVKLSYNQLKQLTEVKDWLGITSIDVDELGRARKVTDHNGNEVQYTFGSEGERTGITYPDGKVAEYVYDDVLRLKSLTNSESKVDYSYDLNGRLSDKVFSSGVSTKYSYNDMGLLSELAHSDNDGILDKYIYSYDNMVNKVGIEKQRRGLKEESGKYTYDYDALSRLIGVSKDGEQVKSFTYDAFGNRSFLVDRNVKTSYQYNALNQLISSADTAGIEQCFSYDKRGNLTQILENGNIRNTYEFSPLNRLTKATNAIGQISQYDYNGLGLRVGKQITNNTADALNPTRHISYILDQTKQYHNLLQMSDNGNTQSFTWDSNVAFSDSNAYLQDELGSPLRYVDSSGAIIDSYGYDEFGSDFYGNQGVEQPFGYTGYTTDIIAGTYFAQAREYLPQTGRFNGVDIVKGTVAVPLTINQYLYCWNSPIKFIDPDGKAAIFPCTAPIVPDVEKFEYEAQQAARRADDVSFFTEVWKEFNFSSAVTAGRYAYNARSEAIGFAREHNYPSTIGNRPDAYRHFTWTYNMTRGISHEVALFVGNGHELKGLERLGSVHPHNDSRSVVVADFDSDTLMDLWNNGVGYRLGLSKESSVTHVEAFNYAEEKGYLILGIEDVVERLLLDGLNEGTHRGTWHPSMNWLFMTGEDYLVFINLNNHTVTRVDHCNG